MTKKSKMSITVYWDEVPGDHGWAYRLYDGEREAESGPLPSRRSGVSDERLRRLAREACGLSRTRTPVEIVR